MNSKNSLFTILFISLFVLVGCKSSQSNYQTSYEQATAKKPTVYVIEEVGATEKAPAAPEVPQKERLTTVSGPAVNAYSVVVGSFVNKTNATSLQERLKEQGYTPTIAQNDKKMYRVILDTFADKYQADQFKDNVIKKFAPEFPDAWVLEQEK
ncbi:SPOR domain-containing protein [Bacteroidales bacterium OttesenSCG-928-M11]|nr:SPOR domain-containing protein [Bacteroidales bacterium OttesenSCG-928-M11]